MIGGEALDEQGHGILESHLAWKTWNPEVELLCPFHHFRPLSTTFDHVRPLGVGPVHSRGRTKEPGTVSTLFQCTVHQRIPWTKMGKAQKLRARRTHKPQGIGHKAQATRWIVTPTLSLNPKSKSKPKPHRKVKTIFPKKGKGYA